MPIITERQAKQRIVEIVQRVKTNANVTAPSHYAGPSNVIANSLGVVVREHGGIDGDGMYLPASPPLFSKPQIVLNADITDPDRRNFTFHHELMHHLIREDDELYSFLHEFAANEDGLVDVIEHFCNMGAAEFLVPADQMRQIIDRDGFSVTLIEALEQQFVASKIALAIQLAHCARHECYVFVCEYGILPDQAARPSMPALVNDAKNARPCLYTAYTAHSNTPKVSRYPAGRFVQIPNDHVISHAFSQRRLLKDRANIPFKSKRSWECDCEAYFFKGKVYAAFNVVNPTSALQISIF